MTTNDGEKKFRPEAKIVENGDGITISVDVTEKSLRWICENVDPETVAWYLLQNAATREKIVHILLGSPGHAMVISTGESFDQNFREQLLAAAGRKNHRMMMDHLRWAVVNAERMLSDRLNCFLKDTPTPYDKPHWDEVARRFETDIIAALKDRIVSDEVAIIREAMDPTGAATPDVLKT